MKYPYTILTLAFLALLLAYYFEESDNTRLRHVINTQCALMIPPSPIPAPTDDVPTD